MLFNSYEFLLLFLPITLGGYFVLQRLAIPALAQCWLIIASFFYITHWNVQSGALLLISLLFNFVCVRALIYSRDSSRVVLRRTLFVFGIIINVVLLGYFKYMDFFLQVLGDITGQHIVMLHIAVSLAVSFYTLQQIAYLTDTYENLTENRSFLQHALFISFFPYLFAGPILHYKTVIPQFLEAQANRINAHNVTAGFFLFSIGLFKKTVIGDTLSDYVYQGFYYADTASLLESWLACISYTLQLYFDFSGYSDMALGTALMFNIRLPANFNSPYRATSLIEYWSRWHISLTRFINAYIYTPLIRVLPGNFGFCKAMVATLLAMLVSGTWHGANWTFIVWGGVQGLALVVNHLWRRIHIPTPRIAGWALTFLTVSTGLVLVRASSLSQAGALYLAMLGRHSTLPWNQEHFLQNTGIYNLPVFHFNAFSSSQCAAIYSAIVLLCLLLALLPKNSQAMRDDFTPSLRFFALHILCLVSSLVMISSGGASFIYFQF